MLWEVMALATLTGGLAIGILGVGKYCRMLNEDCKSERCYGRFLDPTSQGGLPDSSVFSSPSKFLSIIVPCYNEEERLPSMLEDTIGYLRRRGGVRGSDFTYEIIVVDDGSKDGTVDKALAVSKKMGSDCVRVLKLERNRGKGAAVKEGMLKSRGALCLFADADSATEMCDIEKLEAQLRLVSVADQQDRGDDELEKRWIGKEAIAANRMRMEKRVSRDIHDYDLHIGDQLGAVFGSRAHLEKAALARRSFYRNILTHGFHFLVAFAVGKKIKDTQCGFKLFTRQSARLLFPNQRMRRFCFDVELVRIAQKLRIPMGEVHVRWTEVPGSKVKFFHILQMAWELVLIKFGHSVLGKWELVGDGWTDKKQQ